MKRNVCALVTILAFLFGAGLAFLLMDGYERCRSGSGQAIAREATPSPGLTLPLFYTPWPTPTPGAFERMLLQMQSEGCMLPCYLGITPKQTTIEEAETIIESLGGEWLSRGVEGPLERYTYTISPDLEKSGSVYMQVDLYALREREREREKVFRIRSYVGFVVGTEQAEVWNRWYSLRGVFQQMGKPDQVWIRWEKPGKEGQAIAMSAVYQGQDAVFSWYSFKWSWLGVCPGDVTENLVHFHMSLNDYPTAQMALAGKSLEGLPLGQRLKDVVGMDETEFYMRVLADPAMCLKIPLPSMPEE